MAASRPALLITVADEGFFGQSLLRQHIQRGDGHDVVAVNQLPLLIAKQDAVGVAIVRVDVFAVGLVSINNHIRPQFPQHARSGFVSGAMGAIHDDPHSLQGHPSRERCLRMLDVTAQRIVDADCFSDFVWRWVGCSRCRR